MNLRTYLFQIFAFYDVMAATFDLYNITKICIAL